MSDSQANIYYLMAPNRQIAEASPYLEAFQDRNEEVLFCDAAMDDFVMSNLFKFGEKNLVSVEAKDLKLDTPEAKEAEEAKAEAEEAAGTRLTAAQAEELAEWLKST